MCFLFRQGGGTGTRQAPYFYIRTQGPSWWDVPAILGHLSVWCFFFTHTHEGKSFMGWSRLFFSWPLTERNVNLSNMQSLSWELLFSSNTTPLKGDFLPSSQIYFHVDWGERGRSENVGRVALSEMMVRIWLASADDISLNLEGRRWIF